MLGRDTSLSRIFHRRSKVSTTYPIILSILVLTLVIDLHFSNLLPFWLRDLEYIEVVSFVLLILATVVSYVSIRDDAAVNTNLLALGFEPGDPFTFTVKEKQYTVSKTWRYPGGKSFSIKYFPTDTIRVAYNLETTKKIQEKINLESGYIKLIEHTDKILFDIPGLIKVDDFIEIMEMLKNL